MPVGTNQRFFIDAFPCLRLFFGGKCQTQDKDSTSSFKDNKSSTDVTQPSFSVFAKVAGI